MRPLIAALSALTAITLTVAPTAPPEHPSPAAPPNSYAIPGDQAFPTGMTLDTRTGQYYVGSARDGTLYRGHTGRPTAEVWSPDGQDGRSVTSGMTMDRKGRLYVNGAATGTLRVYDPATGGLLAALKGRPGGFVNEATAADDGAGLRDRFLPPRRLPCDGARRALDDDALA